MRMSEKEKCDAVEELAFGIVKSFGGGVMAETADRIVSRAFEVAEVAVKEADRRRAQARDRSGWVKIKNLVIEVQDPITGEPLVGDTGAEPVEADQ